MSLSRDVTIYAEYSEDDITVAAEKIVSVPPICLEGSALDFNGAHDYVAVGPPVLPMGNKSLFAWIKIPPVGESPKSDHDFIIYTASTDATTVWFYFNNGVQLRCLNNSSGGFDARYTVALDDDQWHFVGFTYDDTNTLRLYLDGTEVAASTGNDYSTTTNQEAIGGHAQDINNRSWLGKIDEVRIYNRALSIEEIQANMHVKLIGDELGLVAYWDFDEGEGQVALDLSGNGHDGYLGSDPENPDGADPVWVESEAPAGICPPPSIPELIRQNISEAVEIKQRILEDLETALDLEREAEDMLRDLQRSRDFSELSFRQIVRARVKIVWAIIKEMWSERKLTESKEHLEDSLEIITQEPDLNPAGRPRQRRRSR